MPRASAAKGANMHNGTVSVASYGLRGAVDDPSSTGAELL
jgi:hypothetical protein